MTDQILFYKLRCLLLQRAGGNMAARCRIVNMHPFETYAVARGFMR